MNEMKGEEGKSMRNKMKFKEKRSLKELKNSAKGITLIALVITIIVLLILAAVSIATLTGQNGILSRADESKTQTEIGEEEEAIKLAYNGVMADNLGDGVTAEQLENELQANGYNATATGENPIVVTFGEPSNRVYEIDASGNVAEAKPPVTLEQAKDDSILDETTDTKVQVTDGTIKVPAGFKVADDSGATIDEGIVITDAPDGEEGNEFVWVPVSEENFDTEFVRRAGYSSGSPQSMTNYGEVNAEITPKAQTVTTSDFNNLVGEEGLKLDFDVKVTENRNQLNLYGSYIKGTIPELNGYKPTQVIISGTNVTYEYNAETGEFTAQREAVTNENGVITSNGYTSTSTSSSTVTRINTFNFTVIYPVEAFKAMGEDISSMELAIPIEAVNKGYNNPNTEDGFQNPFISNTATGIVTTTWRLPVEYTYNPYFRVYVGDYMGKPYNTYVVSKEKPINIYNGISAEEKDDIYEVEWIAYTGTNGITDGIIMNEAEGKTDSFRNTATEYISMEELMTNRGIYFGGATSTLGQDGWIKVYDAETDALIETFTSSNWNSYSSSNPYIYENKVKHIRVETSATNEESSFYVYNLKELDDAYITENFTREEFDNITYIYSYLDGLVLR